MYNIHVTEKENLFVLPSLKDGSDFSFLLFSQRVVVKDFDQKHKLLINTFSNAIDLVDNELYESLISNNIKNIPKEILNDLHFRNYTDNADYFTNKRHEEIGLLSICPTFSCNHACTYCFQRNTKLAQKELQETDYPILRENIVRFVNDYRKKFNQNIFINVFGGEPIQNSNKHFLNWLFNLAQEIDIKLAFASNVFELTDFLDLFLKYRKNTFVVCTTLDGIGETHNKMRPHKNKNIQPFEQIVKSIDILLYMNIPVKISFNIDKSNYSTLSQVLDFAISKKWFDFDYFYLEIGRVDDRHYTQKIGNVLTEAEALKYAYEQLVNYKQILKQIKLSFLKTTFYLANAFDVAFNQDEYGRDFFQYCWATSQIIKGYYIAPDLSIYRCTETVGHEKYKIANLKDDVDLLSIARTNNIDNECKKCNLWGYCSGGCPITKEKSFEFSCLKEKKALDSFFLCFQNEIKDFLNKKIQEKQLQQ